VHLVHRVASVPEVNQAAIRDFARQVSDYAKAQRYGCEARKSGVIAVAALAAPKVDSAAKQLAAKPFRLGLGGFAALVQPAVVD
jgi:hypothetical protein